MKEGGTAGGSACLPVCPEGFAWAWLCPGGYSSFLHGFQLLCSQCPGGRDGFGPAEPSGYQVSQTSLVRCFKVCKTSLQLLQMEQPFRGNVLPAKLVFRQVKSQAKGTEEALCSATFTLQHPGQLHCLPLCKTGTAPACSAGSELCWLQQHHSDRNLLGHRAAALPLLLEASSETVLLRCLNL